MSSVPIATILSLTTSKPYFYSSPPDRPWYGVAPTIWSQIMLNLSLVTACIPNLKRFLTDLQSGTMAVQITQAFEMDISQKGSFGAQYSTGSTTGLEPKLAGKLGGGGKVEQHDLEGLNYSYDHVPRHGCENAQGRLNSNTNPFVPAGATSRSTVERSESIRGLTGNIIQRTVDFRVEYESRVSEGSDSRPSPAQGGSWYSNRNEEGKARSIYDIRR